MFATGPVSTWHPQIKIPLVPSPAYCGMLVEELVIINNGAPLALVDTPEIEQRYQPLPTNSTEELVNGPYVIYVPLVKLTEIPKLENPTPPIKFLYVFDVYEVTYIQIAGFPP